MPFVRDLEDCSPPLNIHKGKSAGICSYLHGIGAFCRISVEYRILKLYLSWLVDKRAVLSLYLLPLSFPHAFYLSLCLGLTLVYGALKFLDIRVEEGPLLSPGSVSV